MNNRRFVDLLSRLHKRSKEKRVNWQPTTGTNEYIVYFQDFSLAISLYDQDPNPAEVYIKVLDEEGQHLYTFSIDQSDEEWETARELFELAYNKASRIDESLDSIFKELDSEGEIGRTISAESQTDYGDQDDDIPF